MQNELPLYPNRSVVFCGFLYKTDRHNITEILLKVVLSTIKPTIVTCFSIVHTFFFLLLLLHLF